MRRSIVIKLGILLAGIILVVVSRLLAERAFAVTGIGVILILVGVVSFFFGGDREEDIEQEPL